MPRALTGAGRRHTLSAVRNTNAARTKETSAGDARQALVEEVVETFGSMRGRGMRGIQRVHRGTLSVGHLQVLVRLQLGGPVPVSRLAEWLGVSAAGATGMVGRMEERGLIERGRDERDRRVVLVHLTAKGRAILDEIGSRGRASLRKVLVRLGDDELMQLRNGLLAFQRAARTLAEEEAGEDDTEAPAGGTTGARAHAVAGESRRRAAATEGSEAADAAEDPD